MTERGWRDRIVGDRMQVDQDFAETVRNSSLSRSEWSLVMTAVELDIQGEGESATLVADTSSVESILPELEDLAERMGGMAGGQGDGDLGSGLINSIRSSLGMGSGGLDAEKRNDALGLPGKYATALQRHLEERGKWEDIREAALADRSEE